LYINKEVFHSGIPFNKLKYFSNVFSDNRISYVVTQNGRSIAEHYPDDNCYNSRKQEFQKYWKDITKNKDFSEAHSIDTSNVIRVPCRVYLKNLNTNVEESYSILPVYKKEKLRTMGGPYYGGKVEETFVSKANPFEGEISELAPLAKALMNHKEGEHVNFTTQNEKVHYLVLSVEDLLL